MNHQNMSGKPRRRLNWFLFLIIEFLRSLISFSVNQCSHRAPLDSPRLETAGPKSADMNLYGILNVPGTAQTSGAIDNHYEKERRQHQKKKK